MATWMTGGFLALAAISSGRERERKREREGGGVEIEEVKRGLGLQ